MAKRLSVTSRVWTIHRFGTRGMSLSASFELGSAVRICTNFMVESQSQMERSRATSLWVKLWKSVLRSVRFRSANAFSVHLRRVVGNASFVRTDSVRVAIITIVLVTSRLSVSTMVVREFRGLRRNFCEFRKRKRLWSVYPAIFRSRRPCCWEIISRRAFFVRILPRFVAKGSRW